MYQIASISRLYQDPSTGAVDRKKENYLVETHSFTETEARLAFLLHQNGIEEYELKNISPAKADVVSKDESKDFFYQYIVEYPGDGGSKGFKETCFIQANDLNDAVTCIKQVMSNVDSNYEVDNIKKTKIVDIFPYVDMESERRAMDNYQALKILEEGEKKLKKLNQIQAVIQAANEDEIEPEFEEAARIIVAHQQGSASLLQRKLKIGYNKAGRLIDQLEEAKIIGPFDGSKAREVLIKSEEDLEAVL